MLLMIVGLALWWATHMVKTYAPRARAGWGMRFGEGPVKGAIALASVTAVVLMVLGYQGAAYVPVWTPPGWIVHLNNLAMIIAVLFLGAGHAKGGVKHYVRHPMLWSVVIWATAHLLVNGHLAAIILFGGIGAWAGVAMWGINRRVNWVRPEPGHLAGLIRHLLITAVVYIAISMIHFHVGGVWPFAGGAA